MWPWQQLNAVRVSLLRISLHNLYLATQKHALLALLLVHDRQHPHTHRSAKVLT
jgi:hypothetical protein